MGAPNDDGFIVTTDFSERFNEGNKRKRIDSCRSLGKRVGEAETSSRISSRYSHGL